MLVLFLPKLHTFFFRKGRDDQAGKRSDISGRRQDDNSSNIGETTTKNRELMSINRLLANPNAIDPAIAMAQSHGNNTVTNSNETIAKSSPPTTIFEAHEVIDHESFIRYTLLTLSIIGTDAGSGCTPTLPVLGSMGHETRISVSARRIFFILFGMHKNLYLYIEE